MTAELSPMILTQKTKTCRSSIRTMVSVGSESPCHEVRIIYGVRCRLQTMFAEYKCLYDVGRSPGLLIKCGSLARFVESNTLVRVRVRVCVYMAGSDSQDLLTRASTMVSRFPHRYGRRWVCERLPMQLNLHIILAYASNQLIGL